MSPRIDLYYCTECKKRHLFKSRIGRKHISYRGERSEPPAASTVTPEPEPTLPRGTQEGANLRVGPVNTESSDLGQEAEAPADTLGTVSIEDYLMSLTDALRVHETDIEEMKKAMTRLEAAFTPYDESRQRQAAKPKEEDGFSVPISGNMGERVVGLIETALSRWGGGGGGEALGASKEAVDAIAYEIARKAKIENDTMAAWGDKLREAKSVDFEEGGTSGGST